MELLGRNFARDLLRTSTPLLESIEVKYLSRAAGTVCLRAKKLAQQMDARLSVLVEATSEQGRLLSEGHLVWSNPDAPALPSRL